MSIARQLLDRYFAAALAEDSDAFAALFVDGGLLAYPFSKLQFVGTRAIAERTQRMWAAWPFTPTRYEVTALIECESGLTAEYIVHGTVDATGAALEIGSIAVLDIAEDRIVAMREYVDPVALRAATSSPRELLHRYHAAMRAKDADALAELYAEDGVHEFAFFTPNRPAQLVGREAIRASYREGWANHPLEIDAIVDAFVEDGADPDVVVGQWRLTGTVRETGAPAGITGLLALRVRDGQIVHTHDFMDALGIAHALGRQPFAPR